MPLADPEVWVDQPTARRAFTPMSPTAIERPLDRRSTRRERAATDRTEATISTALAKAQRLIEGRRMTEAIDALELALAALAPGGDGDAACSDTWRIETVLAALYDATGKQERARRMALIAHRHAVRSGCSVAEARASELIDRLGARSRRLARGTAAR